MAEPQELVRVTGLKKHFPLTSGVFRRTVGAVRAVEDVTLSIRKGETLALVGESGCGKSTTGRLLLRLIEASAGELMFDGQDIRTLDRRALRTLRRDMQIIFQDPFSSLNPRMRVCELIAEPLKFHQLARGRAEVEAEVDHLMNIVGLAPSHRDKFPHQFSGGQRQRIGIARALAVRPRFIVCDEPISALDVSIQAQVINLLAQLQQDFGLTYLFISHDLSVVRYVSDRVAVMYLGRIVELADTAALFEEPRHPYTAALLSSIPVPDPSLERKDRVILTGDVPSPSNPPSGCPFHPRCVHAQAICRQEVPALRTVARGSGRPGQVACHLAEDLDLQGIPTTEASA
ncbi:ABC transporter ATP-binding protein [Natronospirillum operosum]|uniref:ABC transporter ATP-binding protein n=1 Tax=Natronospirillum operosum TaxID=2759953 RepID=A0A4Z0WKX6_9GAMM|nr:ABC transporter ATP-binding protein [Natronospirillum operosum]TGG96031.1 ABC transporter ATP-binding protein [Natronospirillum operosum]